MNKFQFTIGVLQSNIVNTCNWSLTDEEYAAITGIKHQLRLLDGCPWLHEVGPYRYLQLLAASPSTTSCKGLFISSFAPLLQAFACLCWHAHRTSKGSSLVSVCTPTQALMCTARNAGHLRNCGMMMVRQKGSVTSSSQTSTTLSTSQLLLLETRMRCPSSPLELVLPWRTRLDGRSRRLYRLGTGADSTCYLLLVLTLPFYEDQRDEDV